MFDVSENISNLVNVTLKSHFMAFLKHSTKIMCRGTMFWSINTDAIPHLQVYLKFQDHNSFFYLLNLNTRTIKHPAEACRWLVWVRLRRWFQAYQSKSSYRHVDTGQNTSTRRNIRAYNPYTASLFQYRSHSSASEILPVSNFLYHFLIPDAHGHKAHLLIPNYFP